MAGSRMRYWLKSWRELAASGDSMPIRNSNACHQTDMPMETNHKEHFIAARAHKKRECDREMPVLGDKSHTIRRNGLPIVERGMSEANCSRFLFTSSLCRIVSRLTHCTISTAHSAFYIGINMQFSTDYDCFFMQYTPPPQTGKKFYACSGHFCVLITDMVHSAVHMTNRTSFGSI